ncbi:glutathione binding-like protein [Candidatus Burkholderia verschuerenii]|uniref:glutathione binding-like protein n=1 Tax=Candidatus Burkholderia verschuerenii TaxID=242163 RepID=UPI0009FA2F2E
MYLTGDEFTIADAYLFALTRWGKAHWFDSVYSADIDLGEFQHLCRWYRSLLNRPSVVHALGQNAM